MLQISYLTLVYDLSSFLISWTISSFTLSTTASYGSLPVLITLYLVFFKAVYHFLSITVILQFCILFLMLAAVLTTAISSIKTSMSISTVFTRNIPLWFSWMFSLTPSLWILFTIVNCHCFHIWFSVLIPLNNIYKLLTSFSPPSFIHSAFQPNLTAAFLFFILLIAFIIIIFVILSFLHLCLLVICWNSFSILHCICVSSAVSDCLVCSRFS